MRTRIKRFVSLVLTTCMVATTVFTNMPVALADGAAAGTPYQSGGAYDVTVPHIEINQVYGGYNPSKDVIQAGTNNVASYKDKGQACSNSFIELYNPTDSDVNLSGWSVQVSASSYFNSNLPVGIQNGKWALLPLTGTIRAHSSYLIRGAATGSTAPFLTISNRDQDWAMPFNTKGTSVALMSNTTTLTTSTNPFDNTAHAPAAAGYVDMIGVSGNDSTADERVFAYEGSYTWSQSKQKAIRRMAFADTDNNAAVDDAAATQTADTQVIGYNTTDAGLIAWARPRYSGDGAWAASPMPPAVESTVLSTTTPNCLTNTFGSDPKTTRTLTWEMPSSFPTGGVEVSTASDLSSPTLLSSTVTTADGGVANTDRVSVTGLSAGTTYYYRADSGAARSPIYSFKTEGDNDSSFSFLHVSDTQADVDTYTAPTVLDYQTWGKAVGAVAAAYHPSFLLHTGDIVDTANSEDQWRWFFKEATSTLGNYPLMPAIGNHDESAVDPATSFRQHFTVPNACTDPAVTPGTVYSFDYGNAHFVVLNTENKGSAFTAQYNWADQDMAATHKKFIIVALHRGMYEGTGLADTYDAFGSLLDKYKVALVLQGHEHAYYRTDAMRNGLVTTNGDGTVCLETGGSGSKQDNAPALQPYMAVATTPGSPCYSVITVTNHNIDVHTVVVQTPITSPNIAALQSAGPTITPAGATIDFDIAVAPEGLAGIAPTTVGGTDGRITGTTDAMEYQPAAGGSWTSCTASETAGLASGSYVVRYKATHDSDTLQEATVTVAPAPPVTSISSLPSGWANHDVPFSLTATDDLTTGTVTSYRLTPGGATIPATEGTVTAEGTSTIEYWSVDAAGNEEAPHKTAQVMIDKHAPSSTSDAQNLYSGTATVHIAATDALSGVAETDWRIDGGDWATGTVAATSAPGAHTLEFYSTDAAGNQEATQVATFTIDSTAPSTVCTPDASWRHGPVSVSLTATDDVSAGILTFYRTSSDPTIHAYGAPFSVSAEGTTTIEYWSVDAAGNEETPHNTTTVRIDQTAPTIDGAATTLPNAAGWYNHDVTVHFSAADSLSGVANVTGDVVLSAEGTSLSATGWATDNVGNTASKTVSGIAIDKSAPTIPGTPEYSELTTSEVDLQWDGSTDALSGVDHYELFDGATRVLTLTGTEATLTVAPESVHQYSVVAVDAAGNRSAASGVLGVDVSTGLVISGPSKLVTGYNKTVTISVTMADAQSQLISKKSLVLEKQNAAGVWVAVEAMKAGSRGVYSAKVACTTRTLFRAHLLGDSEFGEALGGTIEVLPQASLSIPKISTSKVKVGVAFTISGTMAPAHTGKAYVTIELQYRSGSTWVSIAPLHVLVAAGSSTYSVATSLPTKGSWRVRAVHSDSTHAYTASGYRLITSK